MATAPRIITETDDDDGPLIQQDHGAPNYQDLPDNIVNIDRGQSQAQGGRSQAAQTPEFEVIETDDQGQPLSTHAEPQEASLATEHPDDEPRQNRRASEEFTRSQRRRFSKDKDQQRIQALERQIADLSEQVGQVGPRFQQMDAQQRDQRINQYNAAIQHQVSIAIQARQQLAEAIANGNAENINAALDARDRALVTGNRLTAERNVLISGSPASDRPIAPQNQSQQQRQAPQPAPIPTAVRTKIQDFQERHDWCDLQNPSDVDSRTVLAIDQYVADQGFDPRTQEYWDEVEDLMRERLPHRFQKQQSQGRQQPQQTQAAQQRRGPAVAAAPASRAAPGKNQVYISQGRKQQMIQDNIVSADGRTVLDPERYTKRLASYQKYDRENGVTR